jgi:hypothetical protein
MNQFIDITDREEMRKAFAKLNADTTPIWGSMTAQQMVEHMIDQVEYTNGKKTPTLDVDIEDAAKSKQLWIYTDATIPKNIILGVLPKYIHPGLAVAIDQLFIDLDIFDGHFKQPGHTEIHGGFGPMDYKEWLIWHGKHFTHHLKQFNLI